MRVLILGGGGEVGRHIVTAAERITGLSRITIGERDVSRAHSIADDCSDKVRGLPLDITDEIALEVALSECDVVVSCVGPYYKFGTRVLSAAIDAGCHYVDVCDDWEPTLEMLELDQRARDAAVSAVVGMGASPGVSNLLASAAHSTLDEVEELHTIWGTGDLEGPHAQEEDVTSRAALEHWLLQSTGQIRVHQGGRATDVAPLAERTVTFPEIGDVRCFSLGHPEPVTLPLTFPELNDSLNLMNLPAPIVDALRRTAHELDAKKIDMEEGVARLERRLGEGDGIRATFNGLRFLYAVASDAIKNVKYAPEVCALAIGETNGKPARAGAWVDGYLPGGTGGSTGLPVAAVLKMFSVGQITRTGVFAPERGVDATQFFRHLENYAIRPTSSRDVPFLRICVEKGFAAN